ncbi:group-specific protein [Bacillus haikouensis]|uniref:group-specific protein n=1 Tax=Bacillus haikouensis TaxID=1510468 RepID=UPI001556EA14|nr:group-specific protein [Bacillus haikouensis]NQD65628.1 group-specific protein [Bacillus haikouensis]
MKFYIASSLKNIHNVRYISEKLKLNGHTHTFDWTTLNPAVSLEKLQEIGQLEKEAVIQADVVIMLLPAGKGSHIELGIALALDKRIILYSSHGDINNLDETSSFYHLSQVEKFLGDKDDLVNFILDK